MRNTRHRIATSIRDTVRRRAQGKCELCGQQCNQFDLHHRQQRSVGGKDQPSNLMAVHRRCHNLIHDDEMAERFGWIVPSHQPPGAIRCLMFDGYVYLTNLGTREAKLP